MSAMTIKLSNIRRVAIIGAGAGGLVAARALREEGCFDTIDVLEQRGDVGGVWNYTGSTAAVSVPSTDPTVAEAPVGGEYISAVYDNLGMSHPAATRAELTTQKQTSRNS
jgi:cation diffusion facilitator CzcD-associated flavoprotein CzcO